MQRCRDSVKLMLHFALHGGGVMNDLQECRAQEARCRSHAETDQLHRDLWLSMAERWSYLALKEIAALSDKAGPPHSARD
jgi:hypothetical protein